MRWCWILCVRAVLAQSIPPVPAEVMRAAMEKQQAAAARQRESIRKQADHLGVWLGGGPDDVPAPRQPAPVRAVQEVACDPISDALISPIVAAAAKAQRLEPKLIRAVIEQESAYRPCALSAKGAQGLMQLMPETAGELGVVDPFDPKANVEGGARYLRQLLDKYAGDLSQALGAYNAGPGTVDQAGGVPNVRETRDYVKAILQKLSGQPPP